MSKLYLNRQKQNNIGIFYFGMYKDPGHLSTIMLGSCGLVLSLIQHGDIWVTVASI